MVPLGLFSLGICLFLISAAFSRHVGYGVFIPYGIFTGGIGLIAAGMFALRAESDAGAIPYGGTAFTLLGTFFASSAFYQWFFLPSSQAPDAELAWIALAWTIVLLALAVVSFNVPTIPGPGKLLWVLIFAGFFFAWLNGAFHMDWARTVAGACGILAAILAWAGGFMTLRIGAGPAGGR